jgi:peptidoglycan/xylan/chitin deacetylase (PgdA/CDA1 family)
MLAVVNYHYIRPAHLYNGKGVFGVTPDEFYSQLRLLLRFGTFISAQEIPMASQKGRAAKELFFHITFDDGLREQYDYAVPILRQLGISATFFLNTENFVDPKVSTVHKIHLLLQHVDCAPLLAAVMEKLQPGTLAVDAYKLRAIEHYFYDSSETAVFKYLLNFVLLPAEQGRIVDELYTFFLADEFNNLDLYMSENQIDDLMNCRQIGSHGHSHKPMGRQLKTDLMQDFFVSQNWFRQKNYMPAVISYPYGSYESLPLNDLDVLPPNFEIGFSMERVANEFPLANPLFLGRFDCNDLPGGKVPFVSEADLQARNFKTTSWFA